MASSSMSPESVAAFWQEAEQLRGRLRVEYFRHVVLGLLFLRVVAPEHQRADCEQGEPHIPSEAHWRHVLEEVRGGGGGAAIDRALAVIAEVNPSLTGMPTVEYAGTGDGHYIRRLVEFVDRAGEADGSSAAVCRYLGGAYASWLVRFAGERKYAGNKLSLSSVYLGDLTPSRVVPYGAENDITSLGPSNYPQPLTKPFFVTPKTTYELSRQVRVGFDGTNYLVVWCESHYKQGDWLMGCRISPQGSVLDPGGFVIHKAEITSHLQPRLAMGKDAKTGKPVALIVWGHMSPWGATVRGAMVRTAGTDPEVVGHLRTPTLSAIVTGKQAVTSAGIPIFPDIDEHWTKWGAYTYNQGYGYPDVAFNGSHFVVTATTGLQVIARLVSSLGDGVVVEQPPQTSFVYPWGKPITLKIWQVSAEVTAVPGYGPMTTLIASGGGPRCLVTWPMLAAPGRSDLYGAKVVFDGLSWKIGQAKVVSTDVDPPYGNCAMASDGQGNYLLSWHDICNRATKKTQPWQVAWPDLARAAAKSVPGQPLDFTVAGSTLMFQANQSDYYPNVAYDGKNYLVMWGGFTSDLVNFNAQLGCLVAIEFGGYVTPDSQLLEAFYIKPGDGGHAQLGDVCFGTTEGLVVYRHSLPHEYPRLRAQFVAKTP